MSCYTKSGIGHFLNEQGTGYKYLKSIELKNGARHLKEHPNISKFTKFDWRDIWTEGWFANFIKARGTGDPQAFDKHVVSKLWSEPHIRDGGIYSSRHALFCRGCQCLQSLVN